MSPFLSVVIPAYNESQNLNNGVLNSVHQYLQKQKYQWEVIIVDDGSTDDTPQLLSQFVKDKPNWRIITNPHQGKAPTVKTGVFSTNGKYILLTDFDQATPLSEIEKLLPFMKKGYHIAIGSREIKGSRRLEEPWHRHLMGKGFNFGIQLIALRGIHDTQCGFKLFTGESAKDLFNRLIVYGNGLKKEKFAFTGAYDVELLFIAQKLGYKIAEVPIYWRHLPTERIHPLRDSLRMAFDVIKIRLTDLFGGYQ